MLLEPTAGTARAESDTVSVVVNAGSLPAGTITAVIKITSDGGDAEVPLTAVISENLEISIVPDSLKLGPVETADVLVIANQGNVLVDWTLSTTGPVELSSNSGSVGIGEQDTVGVSVDLDALGPGEYPSEVDPNLWTAGQRS